ncbi:putative ubiquitin-conjugating enzyme/RWD [Helianthus anomalus]
MSPEIHPSESGLNTSNRCFQINISLQDDETESNDTVQWGLVFSHAHKYPDEIPLLNLRRCLATHPHIIILMMHWAHCFLIIVYQLTFFNMPIIVY